MEPKGGISPIVALTLLFVVAVVSVVGLQSWYQSYSSDLFANVDEETMNRAMIQVDGVYGGTLYIRQQQGDDNTSLKTVKVNNEDCQINGSLSQGVNRVDVSTCLENVSGSRADISLITNSGVVTHTISLDGKISASNSSVTSLSCPTGFVEVPGDSTFSTNDFCVMQYEAKENGGAVSEPTGQPWVNISLSGARTACSNLGSDYHLMTNAEWMSMARNLEQRTGNWYGSVGSGFLYVGHSDEAPNASLNASSTSDAFYRTGDQSDSCDSGTSWSSKGATQLNTSLSQVFSHNDDLLGMYLLNGTGEEMTNRGVDGTSYGGVTADTDRLGISGGASRFDGDDTYIDISGKVLNITSDITLSTWFYAETYPSTYRKNLIYLGDDGNDEELFMGYDAEHTGDVFQLGYYRNNWNGVWTTNRPSLASWHHATCTYTSSSGNWSCYLNGSLLHEVNDPFSLDLSQQPDNSIGNGGSPSEDQFDGLIDEVMIFNTSLNRAEIKTYYDASRNDSQLFSQGGVTTTSTGITSHVYSKTLSVTSMSGSPTVSLSVPVILGSGDPSTTGTGEIVLNWSEIDSPEDIAVYDTNGNVMEYAIDYFSTTEKKAVLYVYGNWTRDGSGQLQIVYGTPATPSCQGQQRIHTLSNGNQLWDVSGNVWEWTNDTFSSNSEASLGMSEGWQEWSAMDSANRSLYGPSDGSWNSSQSVGQLFTDTSDASPSGSTHGLVRGGSWLSGKKSGIYGLRLDYAPSNTAEDVGFRCVYNPE